MTTFGWCLLAFAILLIVCTIGGVIADERAEKKARREAEARGKTHAPQAWRGTRGRA